MKTRSDEKGGNVPSPAGGTGDRFSRQANLPMIGPSGQCKLEGSTVLIVGCGALGGIQAELLTRAGVGTILLADRDIVELHNLQRQFLFDEEDVRARLPKAEAAARHLRRINGEIAVTPFVCDVTLDNVLELLEPAALVLDGTDNFETRFLLNDACVSVGKPFIYGGVLGSHGTVMAISPGKGSCLRCLLPELPEAGVHPTCETFGVLNTAVAWVASLQVTEALKFLLGAPEENHRLHSLDIWHGKMTSIVVAHEPSCLCCGQHRFEFLAGQKGAATTIMCGRNAVQISPRGAPGTARQEVDSPQKTGSNGPFAQGWCSANGPDFELLRRQLEPLGTVTATGFLLEFIIEDFRMIFFPDGRILVMGTTDPAVARSLVAKYVGA